MRKPRGDEEAQRRYLNLLRSWFKNGNFTSNVVAAAYMTGILPIKKDGSQSAISDFKEYSMLYPGAFARYTGFSEHEVAALCSQYGMDFSAMKAWYDGYELGGLASVYNPYSVMNALEEGTCRSFWGRTSAAEGLSAYIEMDYDGLQEDVASLITGENVSVNPSGFQNDLEHFRNKDDILTLLVHLGYLTWDSGDGTVHIPNQEVREEFLNFLKEDHVGAQWKHLFKRSRKL